MSSLLSRRGPSFWVSHSGLGSAHIIFFTIEPSVGKSIWRLECDRDLGLNLSVSNGLRILNKDLTRFLLSRFFLVELRKALLAE